MQRSPADLSGFLDGFLIESRRVVIAKPTPNPSTLDGYALEYDTSPEPKGFLEVFFIEIHRVFGRVLGWEHVPLNAVS